MRELILKMSMSIDGFVGGPNGEIDWLFRSSDPTSTAWTVAAIREAGLHVMGHRTFRDMAAFWPTSTQPFAAPMNEIPKLAFSRGGTGASTSRALADARADVSAPTADPQHLASWSSAHITTKDLGDEIARLKQESGKPIIAHGGSSFAQALVERDLIDEYRLLVHPVVLGRGLPLFASARTPFDLKLVETTSFPAGAVAHVYRRAR